jgi:hypothetical protein
MWTPEFKIMVLMAAALGLAIGVMLAYLETVRDERMLIAFVYKRDEIPPADISALHEEVRRIQKDANE